MAHNSDPAGLFEDSFMYPTPEKEIMVINDKLMKLPSFFSSFRVATGNRVLLKISESVSPMIKFNKALNLFPYLRTELRKFPMSRNAAIEVLHLHRSVYIVANAIFSDCDENKNSLEMCNRILSRTIYQNGTDISNTFGSNRASVRSQDYSKDKTAYNIAMRLRDNESTFYGNLFQCLEDY